jgi:hypothetical protein
LVDLEVSGVTKDSKEWEDASRALEGYNNNLRFEQENLKAAEKAQQEINQELDEYDKNMA